MCDVISIPDATVLLEGKDAAADANAGAGNDDGREMGEEIESVDTSRGAGIDTTGDAGIRGKGVPTPAAAPCLTP